jgi:oligopeptide transport system substrate-binding protein
LVGANEYADGTAESVAGITVSDAYTLKLELINPFSGFPNLLTILATAAYPKEAIDTYGYDGMQNKIVGSGPFIPTTIENGNKVIFVKNKNYWRKDEFGNQLPLLNQIEFTFIKDKNAELKAFQDDKLDMLWGIPVEEIQNIMGSLEEAKDGLNKEFEVQSINSLNVQYYGFLYTSEVFEDVRVRQAFNYAVDRDSLTNFVLQGEGSAAHNGFVPEMSGYPSETVTGFDYNPEKAKKLMRDAGFPGGKGFPEITLNLNASGGVNEKIADAITYMLNKNLGVNIALNVMPMSELHPKVERGELDFWRFGWIADYPDPSNFLYLFHSKSINQEQETSINYFRYSNPEFDEVYEASLVEINAEKRMKLYAQADQILMDDAVIMPLFFNIDIRLIDPDLQDFDINEMEYRDLSVVYYKKTNKNNVRVYDILENEEAEEQ